MYRWPRRNTKRFALLVMLLSGIRVTHMSVLDRARTYRAAAHVAVLKEYGFPIDADLRTVSDADGRRTRIAYYSIDPGKRWEILDDARQKGWTL
jgi:hypothetical protein